jgi:hypothetical protein
MMVSASLGALSWVFLIQPYVDDAELSTAVKRLTTCRPRRLDGSRRGTGSGTTVIFYGDGGVDRADYSGSSSGVLVDLDGAADDGRLGLDHDNVTTSVENLTGSNHADSLRGTATVNRIVGDSVRTRCAAAPATTSWSPRKTPSALRRSTKPT